MAIKLSTTGAATTHVKVLNYGAAGVGKTMLIATAPDPIIINTEGGLLSLAEHNIPVITVSSIEDLKDAFLFITTSEWEVSVGFGENFHTRFGSDGDPGETHFFDTALAFIEDFVAERLVVATARQDNEWLGAWPVDRTRENIDELTVEPGVTLTIRSWRGTFDRKVVTAE